MTLVRAIFYFEVASNLASSLYALFVPAAFVGQFSAESLPVTSVELGRWYAVPLVVLALILLAALRSGTDQFLRPVLAAFLLGDALQIGTALQFGSQTAGFPLAVHAAICLSVIYAAARVYYLLRTRPNQGDLP